MSLPVAQAMRVLRDVAVPLRDGVRTVAEVWLPDDGAARPAILVRTPYEKEAAAPTALVDPRLATARGYAVVLQDVRGRGGSGGAFEPFVNEQADGADSVAWVAAQPWCDGRVVMAGGSYVGATQWLAAVAAPPALRALAPTISSDEFGEGWSYEAGVPELAFLVSWCAGDLAPPAARTLDDVARAWSDVASVETAAPWLAEWLAERPGSDYWRARSVAHRRDEVVVPSLVVAGWYDVFLNASLRSFARSRDARDRLVIGPWGHDDSLDRLVGEADLGARGDGGGGRVFGWTLDFYDAVLAGREARLPRVRAYALGARSWVDLETWPPAGVGERALPLEAGAFAVDPSAPVPARGGRGLQVHVPGWGYGPVDQRPLLDRDDVHVALRATLDADTLLAGPLMARLATAAAGDGEAERLWVATLCVEQSDGALRNLGEGVAAAQPAEGRVEVALGDAFALLPGGTTIALLVAGSSFPRWPVPASGATQSVLGGSTLALTVAPPALLDRA